MDDQALSPTTALQNRMTATTIDTGDIFPPSTVPTPLPAPILVKSRNIIISDGSVQTIIMPMPAIPQHAYSGRAQQVLIRASSSSRRQSTRIQTTDIFLPARPSGSPENRSYLETDSTTELYVATSEFRDAVADSVQSKEKRSTFGKVQYEEEHRDHKPAGRWSDPFTLAWRGSQEAEASTRWKSAQSGTESQNGRLRYKSSERGS